MKPIALGLSSHLKGSKQTSIHHNRHTAAHTISISPGPSGSFVGLVSDIWFIGVGLCLSRKSRA